MSKRPKTAVIERDGVLGVGQIVNRFGWAFREQPTDDYGIDANAEVFAADGSTTGNLIALQIKAGRRSYFKRETSDGWKHYVKRKHASYWLKHALPVVVVLWDEVDQKGYWQAVTPQTLVETPEQYKITIPRTQRLGPGSERALRKVADGDPYLLRVRRLRLALPWMHLLTSGRRILLEAVEWVNKTSGRGDITIVSVNENNEDRQPLGSWSIIAPGQPYELILPSLVPWADVVVHEKTYDIDDQDAYIDECVYEGGDGEMTATEMFDDWSARRRRHGLRPYRNVAGEVDHWRLELQLNALGRGFVIVDEFAEAEGQFLTPQQ